MKEERQKKSLLTWIEQVGNALPHPATIFLILCLFIAVLSGILAIMNVSVEFTGINRVTNEIEQMTESVQSLLSKEGLQFIFLSTIDNFTSFAPLGAVLVAMLGVGVAEGSGLISSVLKKLVMSTPKRLITVVIVFVGMFSSIASDAGYVVVIPLGAMIFMSLGRHPLAGLAAAFAGVAGGFGANIIVGPIDSILAGLTTEAARLVDPTYTVGIDGNWWFAIASTLLLTVLGTFVTEKIVEPRLGVYKEKVEVTEDQLTITLEEKRGLRFSGIAALVTLIAFILLVGPAHAPLRGPDPGMTGILASPFMDSFVFTIAIFFAVVGTAYGIGAKTIKDDKDVMNLMGQSMSAMGSYIVLVFFAAQFVAYFNYTNIGTVLAVFGADALVRMGLTGIPLIILFMIVVTLVNFVMGSASAKWAILAPIFVPMMMEVGLTPEFIQASYRVADSATNVVSPLMNYFALVVTFTQKYHKDAGIGTLISMMMPFTIIFLIGWTLLLILWYVLNLNLGPGVGVFLINMMNN